MNTRNETAMNPNDGGPAFPSARDMRHNPDFDHEGGMSVRDHFAGLAMAASIIAHPSQPPSVIAADAFLYADAMLRAREAGQ